MMQLLMAVINTNSANITFALLMVHNVYCKINEYRATFLFPEQILDTVNRLQNVDSFHLKKKFGEAYPIIAEHLECLPKARKKLPQWTKAGCIFPKIPYEQSSSEAIAQFHAQWAKNDRILSITGGLGVDEWAFERAGARVVSLDTDPCLNALFQYNSSCLNLSQNQRLNLSAESFLEQCRESYDLLYADPDRRPQGVRTAGHVAQHSPDVFALYRKYPKVARRWLIKLSPVTDISWLFQQNIPMDIYVAEQDGEVRELLCDLYPEAGNRVFLVLADPPVRTIRDVEPTVAPLDFEIFAEASAGCIKAGLNRHIGQKGGLSPINPQHTYFTGRHPLPEGTGRNFKLLAVLSGSLNRISAQLKEMGITQATVSARDFVLKPEEILRKMELRDGGHTYLFFSGRDQKSCFVCEKF